MKRIFIIVSLMLAALLLLSACGKGKNKGHTHEFGEWKTVTPAGCTADGLKERFCSCGERETEKIPVTHSFAEGSCSACGQIDMTPTADIYFTFTELSDGSYSIAAKDVTNLPKSLVIPATYNGKPVSMIAEKGFTGYIREIENSDNLEYISCQIVSLVIPDSVKVIGKSAFETCYDLSTVVLGNSVENIDDMAFYGCAFSEVELPNSLKRIGTSALSSLIRILVLPESLTTIAPSAFNNSAIVTITIPESVTEIGEGAFGMCSFLCEIVNNSRVEITGLPYSDIDVHTGESRIVNIDDYLFYQQEEKNFLVSYVGNEKDLTLPSSFNGETYAIRRLAFAICREIESVRIPEGVTEIGASAFVPCNSLKTVYIPKSVNTIYAFPFGTFGELANVHYAGTEEEGRAITIIMSKNYGDKTYYLEDVVPVDIKYNSN